MKKLMKTLLVRYFLVSYIRNISYFYSKQHLVIYFCDCSFVYFFLFGRFMPIRGKLSSDRIRHLEQNWSIL